MNCNTFTSYYLVLFAAIFSVASSPALGQPEYSFAALPLPAGTTASEPVGVSYHETGATSPKRYLIAGRSIDAASVSHAVVWTQANDGTWGVELLPVTNPSADSDDWAVDSFFDIVYEVKLTAGSTGNPAATGGQQPAVWTCTDDPCTWVAETVIVPSGFTGGEAKKIAHFKAGSTVLSRACGVLSDSTGGTKAVVWARDAASLQWLPTLLPGLVNPDLGSSANGMAAPCDCGTQIGWAIVGAAMDSNGHSVPVRWSCDDTVSDCTLTASWSVIALPVPAGVTQGECLAVSRRGRVEVLISTRTATGGTTPSTHGAAYICDGTVYDCDLASSWTVIELLPLPGYSNCHGFGIKEDGVNIVAGGSSDNGAGTSEVATDWVVDLSVSPPTVSVYDVNNLVPDLPSNITLKKKGEVKDVIKLVLFDNSSLSMPGVSATSLVGNAAVLTEVPQPVPTVSEWGLVVMALLTLVAGTVVYYKRGIVNYCKQ